MSPRLLFLSILGMIALTGHAGLGVAASPDPDLPKAPGPNWRYLTFDDATTTSKCIGSIKTPLCAVETIMAGFFRGDDRLAWIAGDHEPDIHPDRPAKTSDTIYDAIKYRVLTATRVREEDIPARNRKGPFTWHVGDVMITLDKRFCRNGDRGCRDDDPINPYIIRKMPIGWQVIDWATSQYRPLPK